MKRRGRRHLPKVRGQLAPLGFEHSAFTFEGTIERAGAFARGVATYPRTGQRRAARIAVAVFLFFPLAGGIYTVIARFS